MAYGLTAAQLNAQNLSNYQNQLAQLQQAYSQQQQQILAQQMGQAIYGGGAGGNILTSAVSTTIYKDIPSVPKQKEEKPSRAKDLEKWLNHKILDLPSSQE